MNKTELIAKIADTTGLPKKAVADVIDAQITHIKEAVSVREEVSIAGLFTLKHGERAARTGRNPTTGETIQIAACKTVKIKPAKALDDAANGG